MTTAHVWCDQTVEWNELLCLRRSFRGISSAACLLATRTRSVSSTRCSCIGSSPAPYHGFYACHWPCHVPSLVNFRRTFYYFHTIKTAPVTKNFPMSLESKTKEFKISIVFAEIIHCTGVPHLISFVMSEFTVLAPAVFTPISCVRWVL